jgi:hypothetical protein
MEEALELAEKCAVLDDEVDPGHSEDGGENPWKQSAALSPLLLLALRPGGGLLAGAPANFQEDLRTCAASLLQAERGHLLQPRCLLDLLDSSASPGLVRYLTWLQASLGKAALGTIGVAIEPRDTELEPLPVESAISSWQSECTTLQKSATALGESIMIHGPAHHANCMSWKRANAELQRAQRKLQNKKKERANLAKAFLHPAGTLDEGCEDSGDESSSWEIYEYEKLACKYRAGISAAREHVRRRGQAFSQAAERFLRVAGHLLNWTGPSLVPDLLLLDEHREDLRTVLQLRQRICEVEQKHLAAEDETEVAQAELRRHYRRHQPSAKTGQEQSGEIDIAVLEKERRFQVKVRLAEGRVRKLARELMKGESQLQEAEVAFPFTIDSDDDGDNGNAGDDPAYLPGHRRQEALLALKVAELEQLHEDMAIRISEVSAERDAVFRQWACERRERRAQEAQAELEFICPILHERMKEPVVAADGHTYERQAIEKWMTLRNTSPMTGATLKHRFLTKNFALRSIMTTHNRRHQEKKEEKEEEMRDGAEEVQ